jgi:hypothetical protein
MGLPRLLFIQWFNITGEDEILLPAQRKSRPAFPLPIDDNLVSLIAQGRRCCGFIFHGR